MSAAEKRILAFAAVSGLVFLVLTVLHGSIHAFWFDVLSAAVGSVALIVAVWLGLARARQEPAYARRLRYATLFFVPWVALMLGLAFVVPEGWVLEYAVGGVAVLAVLAQLAKRLARS
jgi:hypothetical protein